MTGIAGQETFEAGDNVMWKRHENDSYMDKSNREKYGDGPFEIMEVRTVPENECLHGRPITDEGCPYMTDEGCPYQQHPSERTRRESVGHHQWVSIANNGNPIMGYADEELASFSGYWFQKV